LIVVYLVKSGHQIFPKNILINISPWCSYAIYLLVPIITTIISIVVIGFLDSDSIEIENGKSKINFIEQANNEFLPSYLGYFFVALSIPNTETLIISYFLIYGFTFCSQALYYNPIFLLFGFNFYYITTINDIKIFILTKQKLKNPSEANFTHLKRINNFTFIDTYKL
jgi:hypothetical protein